MARLPPKNNKFYRMHVWDLLWVGKEVAFTWSIKYKVVVVNEWRACIAPTFILKQCIFASRTQVNWSNTSSGIAFRLGVPSGGPPLSCTNFVGLKWAIMIVVIENMSSLVKGPPRNLSKIFIFGILIVALLFGPFGLNAMKMFSTENNGMNPRLNTLFGMTSLCTPRQLGRGGL